MEWINSIPEPFRWIISFIASSGLVYWFIQKYIDNKFCKDLEKYKIYLDIELEKAKATFNSLHSKRIKIISSLYKKLVAVNTSLASLTSPLQLSGEPPKEEKIKKAINDYNKFLHYFDDNRIYFTADTSKKIDSIVNEFRDVCIDYDIYYPAYKQSLEVNDGKNAKEFFNELTKAWNKVKDDIPKVKSDLEEELRKIIGV